MEEKVVLEHEKYTLVQDDGSLKCLRYGEEWRDLTGDKMVGALFSRVRQLEAQVALLTGVPPKEMWGGLARDIIFWLQADGAQRPSGASLHRFLKRIGQVSPDWLLEEIPDADPVPPKATIAVCVYRAMTEAAQLSCTEFRDI